MTFSRQRASCLRMASTEQSYVYGQMGRAWLEPERRRKHADSPCHLLSLLKLPLKSEGEEAAGNACTRRSRLYVSHVTQEAMLGRKTLLARDCAKGGVR